MPARPFADFTKNAVPGNLALWPHSSISLVKLLSVGTTKRPDTHAAMSSQLLKAHDTGRQGDTRQCRGTAVPNLIQIGNAESG